MSSILPYLDIHTHRREVIADSVSVNSLSELEIQEKIITGHYQCAGIHPWWFEDFSQEEISQFKKSIEALAKEGKLWAIGETGLDRLYPEYLEKQRESFYWHLALAEEHSLPLIIHSVRSGADFLQVIKEKKPTTPWIFHDFRGNEQLMKDLLRLHPKCYFSFGMSLDNSPQIRELLPLIPLEHLFLETDNQKHLDIHDIYVRAESILHIDMDLLKSQIWQNFKKITPLSQMG